MMEVRLRGGDGARLRYRAFGRQPPAKPKKGGRCFARGVRLDSLRLLGVVVTAPVSGRPVRPRAGEAGRSLPGDALVADAKVGWTHAITIRARPAEIWPWLVQMGCRRAGWYSYDGLDNGGVPSAERIVPELQRVQVGDIFPMTPKAQDALSSGLSSQTGHSCSATMPARCLGRSCSSR